MEERTNSMKRTSRANAAAAKLNYPLFESELGGNTMLQQESYSTSVSSTLIESRSNPAVHPALTPKRDAASTKSRISVLVVTGDSMTSELLKNAFAHGRRGFTVTTLTGSSEKIIGEMGSCSADVTLISEELQDGPEAGIKVLQKTRDNPSTSAIMLLQNSQPERVVKAFRDGARGVFYRSHSLKSLSKCIQTVHEGQIWASNQDVEHLLNALSYVKPLHLGKINGMPLLTRREEDVVRLVVDGLKNREIAERLNVKEHSVRNYIYRIFEKLGVSSRVELTLYAFSRRD
jgi:DNA-binding NarL/FixJ family response regulator